MISALLAGRPPGVDCFGAEVLWPLGVLLCLGASLAAYFRWSSAAAAENRRFAAGLLTGLAVYDLLRLCSLGAAAPGGAERCLSAAVLPLFCLTYTALMTARARRSGGTPTIVSPAPATEKQARPARPERKEHRS